MLPNLQGNPGHLCSAGTGDRSLRRVDGAVLHGDSGRCKRGPGDLPKR